MHYSSFFQFSAFATLATLVDVSYAAPQGPGFAMFGRPGSDWTRPPSVSPLPALSAVCFTSSRAPGVRGPPKTDYTTVTTCTATSTLLVNTTISPPPALTTSTLVTTSTTIGPVSTNTATTSVFTTTTEITTLPVSTVSTVATATQTVSVSFKNVRDTMPSATFAKRQRPATPPGTSPNRNPVPDFGAPPSIFGGDVSCTVYPSQCAVVTQTITSTATLASTTLTSFETSTVIVTSIPVANTTVTTTGTITTTSTVTPDPTTIITATVTTTVKFDKCSPSNMVSSVNGYRIGGSRIDGADSAPGKVPANSLLECCRAATGDPNSGVWFWTSTECYVVSASRCYDQSRVLGSAWLTTSKNSGYVSTYGNGNCGQWNGWYGV